MTKYCAIHDKVFDAREYCEGCGIETREELPPSVGSVEYCATHDKTFDANSQGCPGCNPAIIEEQAAAALRGDPGKPKMNHCAEHDQIFEGTDCPAGHSIEVQPAPVEPKQE
jgi:hypothetical protein